MRHDDVYLTELRSREHGRTLKAREEPEIDDDIRDEELKLVIEVVSAIPQQVTENCVEEKEVNVDKVDT